MDHTAVAAIQRSPAPSLDDVTVAQLRNEWAVLMEDAQRLMPTINKHAADIDRVRFARSLGRLNDIIQGA